MSNEKTLTSRLTRATKTITKAKPLLELIVLMTWVAHLAAYSFFVGSFETVVVLGVVYLIVREGKDHE